MKKPVLSMLMAIALPARSGMPDWQDYPSDYKPSGFISLVVIGVVIFILKNLRK